MQYYGKKAVLLIDEYDVPVAKASSHGYYKEMLDVMKRFNAGIRDNTSLCFAVITGQKLQRKAFYRNEQLCF